MRGIEPPWSAWEADILPLNYTRESFCIITDLPGKCKHFSLDSLHKSFCFFHKNLFTNQGNIAIIHNKKAKEVMTMKVLFQNTPVDIDELIFAGETTVPSDR